MTVALFAAIRPAAADDHGYVTCDGDRRYKFTEAGSYTITVAAIDWANKSWFQVTRERGGDAKAEASRNHQGAFKLVLDANAGDQLAIWVREGTHANGEGDNAQCSGGPFTRMTFHARDFHVVLDVKKN
jgi:hypothetical protein